MSQSHDAGTPFESTEPSAIPPAPETPDVPRTSWPTAVGVIGIILGALGLLGGCCGVVYPFAWPAYVNFIKQQPNVPPEVIQQLEASTPPLMWSVASGVIGLVLAVMLLLGSIKVMRRRIEGVSLCRIWAWIQIPWAIIAIVANIVIQAQMMAKLQNVPTGGAVGPIIGGACGVIFGLGFPIFIVVWFSRKRVKDEIASWAYIDRDII